MAFQAVRAVAFVSGNGFIKAVPNQSPSGAIDRTAWKAILCSCKPAQISESNFEHCGTNYGNHQYAYRGGGHFVARGTDRYAFGRLYRAYQYAGRAVGVVGCMQPVGSAVVCNGWRVERWLWDAGVVAALASGCGR